MEPEKAMSSTSGTPEEKSASEARAQGEPGGEHKKPLMQYLTEEEQIVAHRVTDALEKPAVGAITAGAVVLAAAALLGAPEAAVGALAAYGAYRLLKRRHAHTP